jgi:hypothetical protein
VELAEQNDGKDTLGDWDTTDEPERTKQLSGIKLLKSKSARLQLFSFKKQNNPINTIHNKLQASLKLLEFRIIGSAG